MDVKGRRASTTRSTKREAQDWATDKEREFRAANDGDHGHGKTLRDALRQYAEEESPKRRGERWEIIRLAAFEKPEHGLPLTRLVGNITDEDMKAWRERRLLVVTRGTVIRDMTLLNSLFETARTEWKWIKVNPMADLKRPRSPAHRRRRIKGTEIRRELRALGYNRGPVRSVSHAVAIAFLVALATGMRAKELCTLAWVDVRQAHGQAHNVKAIERGVSRDVPLNKVARRLIERMRGWDADLVFGISTATLDALFRKARKKGGMDGFTFHDSRHTAATRLAKRLDVLTLCKMFGWKDPKMAMIYYNPTAAEIAAMLD